MDTGDASASAGALRVERAKVAALERHEAEARHLAGDRDRLEAAVVRLEARLDVAERDAPPPEPDEARLRDLEDAVEAARASAAADARARDAAERDARRCRDAAARAEARAAEAEASARDLALVEASKAAAEREIAALTAKLGATARIAL